MAEIVTTADRGADLTVRTVTGEVMAQEILGAMASYYAGGTTRFVLWDFSYISFHDRAVAKAWLGESTACD